MRTLLVLLVIYLAIRVLFKYVLPTLLGIAIEKVAEQTNQSQQPPKPEGFVEVKKNVSSSNQSYEGEYVDYEEIK